MEPGEWIYEWVLEAHRQGDQARLRLWGLRIEAFEAGKNNPDAMLSALREARTLAQQLGEKWWVLYLDHWTLQAMFNYKLDYSDVLDLATRSTLETRKAVYANFPERVCLHEDLITAHMGIDPLGNAKIIEQALDYMRNEVRPGIQCAFCVQNCRTEFSLICDDLPTAEMSARITLQMAGDQPGHTGDHHGMYAHADLCSVAHRRGEWDELDLHATEGEVLARRVEDPLKVAEFLVWQAVVARHKRDEETARRRIRQATSRLGRTQSVPGNAFHNGLCYFHEMAGEFDKALEVRTQELQRMAGKGRHHDECRCLSEVCKLKRKLGLPFDADRQRAEEVARKLKDPAPALRNLEIVCGGL